jgi:hypothetical protein
VYKAHPHTSRHLAIANPNNQKQLGLSASSIIHNTFSTKKKLYQLAQHVYEGSLRHLQ